MLHQCFSKFNVPKNTLESSENADSISVILEWELGLCSSKYLLGWLHLSSKMYIFQWPTFNLESRGKALCFLYYNTITVILWVVFLLKVVIIVCTGFIFQCLPNITVITSTLVLLCFQYSIGHHVHLTIKLLLNVYHISLCLLLNMCIYVYFKYLW